MSSEATPTSLDITAAFIEYGTSIQGKFESQYGSIGIFDATDLAQETFLRAHRSFDTFDPSKSSVRSWLFMIAHSVGVDTIRSNVAHKNRENKYTSANRDIDPVDPADVAISQVEGDEAMQALGQISETQRSALLPRILEGKSIPEISDKQGVCHSTVKSRQRDGLIALRDRLMASSTFRVSEET